MFGQIYTTMIFKIDIKSSVDRLQTKSERVKNDNATEISKNYI